MQIKATYLFPFREYNGPASYYRMYEVIELEDGSFYKVKKIGGTVEYENIENSTMDKKIKYAWKDYKANL